MSGHSKWKNIQHRKGRQDALRGKIFTKVTKEIFVAVKNGGADPQNNLRLKMALQKARDNNLPNDNIERTIKKASGDLEGVVYEEILYEGYGPGGVAVMVECLTENRNRTAADVRHAFSKHGGNLGESGCVSFLFQRKGVLTLDNEEQELDEEEVMMAALEAGAEDISSEDDEIEIITAPGDYLKVKEVMEQQGYQFSSAEESMVPSTTVALAGGDAEKMIKLMDALEDNDDVQNVYANFDIDDDELASME
ncbi:YebC/PmpR family DNA-binding transcriptional regulator [Rubeoparvulum massiliense]|uniref:YebC/PmpR family DNA-binding transcriptional regulator n=1 Tax=Rubeoparvulum massiliense TaxID=1631346 RepID=UPI00065E4EFD|nr:YebC/PmpR family DNA-binding transcriptional regulator [Rubeoparvulum massiliense]